MLIRNGFTITDFEEPMPSKEAIRNHYRELDDCDRIPWFLILGAKKSFTLHKMATRFSPACFKNNDKKLKTQTEPNNPLGKFFLRILL